ncbi:MAG TPA: serine hydrolase domain-containing protein [Solirubrobacteraceae bacterium]
MSRLAVLLALVLLVGCGGSPAPAQRAATGPTLAQRLDAELAKQGEAAEVPGVAAAVVVDGRSIWSGAWGMADVERHRKMTPDTPMAFGSITKTLTASLALRLAEKGRLDLDDRISRWLPEWRGAPDMTVRRLLAQTAGVVDPEDDRFYARADRHHGRVIRPEAWLNALPRPKLDPGNTPSYANANYILAGFIVRRAARGDWPRMLRDLRPGLALQPEQTVAARPARGYFYPDSQTPTPWPTGGGGMVPSTALASFAGTAGALAGSTAALARWGNALLGGDTLAPRSLEQMTRFSDEGAMWDGYGLGLAHQRVDDREVWGHVGDIDGFHAELWHLPEENLTMAVAWNDDRVGNDVIPRSLLIVALDAVK